jgi:hypothetical protein
MNCARQILPHILRHRCLTIADSGKVLMNESLARQVLTARGLQHWPKVLCLLEHVHPRRAEESYLRAQTLEFLTSWFSKIPPDIADLRRLLPPLRYVAMRQVWASTVLSLYICLVHCVEMCSKLLLKRNRRSTCRTYPVCVP